MRQIWALVIVGIICVSAVGCSDNEVPNIIDDSFHFSKMSMEIDTHVPGELPLFVMITVELRGKISGSFPPDGELVVFESSGGSFENGQLQTNREMNDGTATASLQIETPGSYELTVSYETAQRTTMMSVSVTGEVSFGK